MTKLQRQENLMPNGVPRYVRCYDNGGETWDRYTAVFSKKPCAVTHGERWFMHVGMSENPFSPSGFGQHGEHRGLIDVNASGFAPAVGRKNHLGRRILFDDLPDDCKTLVIQDYCELWKVNEVSK